MVEYIDKAVEIKDIQSKITKFRKRFKELEIDLKEVSNDLEDLNHQLGFLEACSQYNIEIENKTI